MYFEYTTIERGTVKKIARKLKHHTFGSSNEITLYAKKQHKNNINYYTLIPLNNLIS